MKQQTNLSRPHAGKLSLNKKTISNLSSTEMGRQMGGAYYYTEMRCASQYCTWTCKNVCNGKTYNRPCTF